MPGAFTIPATILGGLAMGAVVYHFVVRSWITRWGATAAELQQKLPGDDLVADAREQLTYAVTINAPAVAVWPWLVQIGQGRGGWYSYAWIPTPYLGRLSQELPCVTTPTVLVFALQSEPTHETVALSKHTNRETKRTMMATQTKLLYQIGFWAAVVAFIGAVGYILSAFLQVFNVVGPLQDSIISFGASLLIPVPFLLTMLVLHYTLAQEKKLPFWTHAAIAFAVIYTTYNTLNYVVQLATVIPAGYTWTFANQQGTQGPLSLLNQTPHSLFWDVDGLGYIFLSLATLFAFPVFETHGLQNWVRWFFIANALIIPLFAIVYFYPGYSVPQLLLGLPWGITVPGSMLVLALFFRRTYA